ncbi:rho GTPase-activating protein 24-like [Urocitellus parryii]
MRRRRRRRRRQAEEMQCVELRVFYTDLKQILAPSGLRIPFFMFEVIGDRMTANHESYLLMASTQNDMEDWVKSIRRVIWGPFGGGIFGQKLEDTVRYEKRYGNRLAPMLVEQCVDFIRQRGLKEEGLFRLPGQANLVKELQDAFDCGEKPSFDRYASRLYEPTFIEKLGCPERMH